MLEAVLLGILQGLTEFLPVSSSAHLTLMPQLLGWKSPLLNSLAFDVALHLGTLLATVAYFWRDLWKLLAAWCTGLVSAPARADRYYLLAWYLGLATLPAVLVAWPLESAIETAFRAPAAVAAWLIGISLVMAAAEYFSRRRKGLDEMKLAPALAIGLAQALALAPGVSRSGITLSAGLALGYQREAAARFSFLLALPVIAGACVTKFKTWLAPGTGQDLPLLLAGTAAAALAGLACIHWLLGYLRRHSLYPFVVYRLLLGAAVLLWAWKH